MPDIGLSVVITRAGLGLPDLQLNDGIRYKIAPQFMGASVALNRNQVSGPWLDGSVTVSRSYQMVTEQIAIEVFGRTATAPAATASLLQLNEAELISAFSQDTFVLTIVVDGATYAYAAEAADYQRAWMGPRQKAKQGQVVFTMPRQPIPIAGGV